MLGTRTLLSLSAAELLGRLGAADVLLILLQACIGCIGSLQNIHPLISCFGMQLLEKKWASVLPQLHACTCAWTNTRKKRNGIEVDSLPEVCTSSTGSSSMKICKATPNMAAIVEQ